MIQKSSFMGLYWNANFSINSARVGPFLVQKGSVSIEGCGRWSWAVGVCQEERGGWWWGGGGRGRRRHTQVSHLGWCGAGVVVSLQIWNRIINVKTTLGFHVAKSPITPWGEELGKVRRRREGRRKEAWGEKWVRDTEEEMMAWDSRSEEDSLTSFYSGERRRRWARGGGWIEGDGDHLGSSWVWKENPEEFDFSSRRPASCERSCPEELNSNLHFYFVSLFLCGGVVWCGVVFFFFFSSSPSVDEWDLSSIFPTCLSQKRKKKQLLNP